MAAEKKSQDAPKEQEAPRATGVEGESVYVTEEAPNLPDANVTVRRGDPVIDRRLIELRDAEAKAQADRLK